MYFINCLLKKVFRLSNFFKHLNLQFIHFTVSKAIKTNKSNNLFDNQKYGKYMYMYIRIIILNSVIKVLKHYIKTC